MLIVGAGGFAKEVLESFHQKDEIENLFFYDDANPCVPQKLFAKFPVLTTTASAQKLFKTVDSRFTLGVGKPMLREKLYHKMQSIGGDFTSSISLKASIGNYDVEVSTGSNLLDGCIISNGATIGKGCIIYYNSIITHDCTINNFVEISPGAKILGKASIGNYSQIGANATVLPGIQIGENVIVAAGAVVTKNVPDNCMVAGVPALIKKQFLVK